MKITANRRDDIIRQRDEYDAETNRLNDKSEAASKEYRRVQYELKSALERKVSDMIGPTSISLRINADPWGHFGANSWSVEVKANEGSNFNDKVALVWNWEVKLDKDGNIVKDSGSWSGLKVVTPEQIADLEESVRVMKILNGIDWKEILNSPMAKWEDYVDEEVENNLRDRKKNRPDFESDLQAAELENLIGGNTAINLKQDQYWRGDVWILPTGLTDKFVKGYIFPMYTAQNHNMNADEIRNAIGEERRSSRSNIVVRDGNIVTMELS